MKLVATTLALTIGLSASAASAGTKSEGGLMTAVHAGFAFNACTNKIRDHFAIGAGKTLNIEHFNADNPPAPSFWDVRFKGSTTKKATGKTTAFQGVCHVRPDKPTTLELTAG